MRNNCARFGVLLGALISTSCIGAKIAYKPDQQRYLSLREAIKEFNQLPFPRANITEDGTILRYIGGGSEIQLNASLPLKSALGTKLNEAGLRYRVLVLGPEFQNGFKMVDSKGRTWPIVVELYYNNIEDATKAIDAIEMIIRLKPWSKKAVIPKQKSRNQKSKNSENITKKHSLEKLRAQGLLTEVEFQNKLVELETRNQLQLLKKARDTGIITQRKFETKSSEMKRQKQIILLKEMHHKGLLTDQELKHKLAALGHED